MTFEIAVVSVWVPSTKLTVAVFPVPLSPASSPEIVNVAVAAPTVSVGSPIVSVAASP